MGITELNSAAFVAALHVSFLTPFWGLSWTARRKLYSKSLNARSSTIGSRNPGCHGGSISFYLTTRLVDA
jgi:hypothetical protein